ncbi:MAG TPA: hypothetical protein VMS21_16465 [Methylomirabilota bacterium]|nr:hypothetical protein [Methylomirabilota bacterium]
MLSLRPFLFPNIPLDIPGQNTRWRCRVGGQEPGTNEQIRQFCQSKFDVTVPLFDKIRVKGEEKHPLYAALTGTKSPFPGEVKWNFGKFLISRDGRIVPRFDSRDEPDSEQVLGAIRKELAAK